MATLEEIKQYFDSILTEIKKDIKEENRLEIKSLEQKCSDLCRETKEDCLLKKNDETLVNDTLDESFLVNRNVAAIFNDISIEPFTGLSKNGIHPVEFVKQLRYKMTKLKIPIEFDRVMFAKQYLEGQALRLFEVYENNIRTFEQFNAWVLENYWSDDMQFKVRTEIFRPRSFNPNQNDMLSHCLYWINKAKYLNPPIEENILVNTIVEHYSNEKICQIKLMQVQTIQELIRVIKILDRHNTQNMIETPYRGNNNSNTRNRNDRYHNNYNNNRESRGENAQRRENDGNEEAENW